jgi:predicted lipid-binding transport protein (Tim44 family)
MSSKMFSRSGLLSLGLAVIVALAPAIAMARAGSGSSNGSRGAKTFSAPPATSTAPKAAPMERSATPQPAQAPRPAQAAPAAQPSRGLFGGMAGGFLAGLVGAGLIGMLMGNGFGGGLGGIASILGLVLQIGLLFLVIRFAMNWWANRNQQQPAMAGASERTASGPGPVGGFGGFGGGAQPQPEPQAAPVTTPLQLAEADFSAFERLLSDIQTAYSDEDRERLARLATGEMAAYFGHDITDHQRNGITNKVSQVKLLQGDLSEAWREDGDDYATVAMRFSMIDVTQERASGRIISGDAQTPVEATEVWTFIRPAGAGPESWLLSAIQQTA